MKNIKVVELFAGVGGFRVALESLNNKVPNFEVVWSNQWEPSTKIQHANMVYKKNWPLSNHSDKDIFKVIDDDFNQIPNHDLLVGGFPCQDYSVATTLKLSEGLKGRKGVLWWAIEKILDLKGSQRPKYLMLENVDRLLISPASQRGRDFAVMLKSLDSLGYAVEWRVVNAAEYGMPQRRRRIFILGFHKSSALYQNLKESVPAEWIGEGGIFAQAFPVNKVADSAVITEELNEDVKDISDNFNKAKKKNPFNNSGYMLDGKFYTSKTVPNFSGNQTVLKDILQPLKEVAKEYYLNDADEEKWKYLKGAKKIPKVTTAGYQYFFSEGGMIFPDDLNKPSRTIITGEGGKSPSRFKHVVNQDGQLRRLTPVELERLNMFPDNHTLVDGVTDTKRAFFMGNALVVGVVKKLAHELIKRI